MYDSSQNNWLYMMMYTWMLVWHLYLINSDIHDTSGHVGALIMCLRRARVMGLLKQGHVKSESDELLYGVVSKHVIKQALNNSEDQVNHTYKIFKVKSYSLK